MRLQCHAWPLTGGLLFLSIGVIALAALRPDLNLDIPRILGIVVPGIVSALALVASESSPPAPPVPPALPPEDKPHE